MPRGTPNTPAIKPAKILIDLYGVVKNFAPDFEYGKLENAIAEAGFLTRLIETDATPCYDGTVLMRYDVMLGRADGDVDGNLVFERVDTVSIKLGGAPGPVSVAGRVNARESVLYLLTGRLPPPKAASAVPQVNGHAEPAPEREVAMHDTDQELVNDDPEEPVTMVERREADGLPIFVDIYSLGAPLTTRQVIDAVLDECHQFLQTASIEQVAALAAKNQEMMAFLKDLGEESDTAELRKLVADRREALTLPPQGAAMRRRAEYRAAITQEHKDD